MRIYVVRDAECGNWYVGTDLDKARLIRDTETEGGYIQVWVNGDQISIIE